MSSPSCVPLSQPGEPAVPRGSPLEASVPAQLMLDVERLYAEHFTLVWRSLLRLGVWESQVEDAVQDVFLVAHRRFHEYEGRSAATTWLYGIALRVAKDYRRAEARLEKRKARLTREQAAEPTVGEGPADALARKEANRVLHELLDLLPAEQRELLVLVDLEGLSVGEVAPLVGLRVRTCQRRLKSARLTFEGALAKHSLASRGEKR
jgi:RNA polymerase sigma-70 factor (ECF subfamily)